jgi:hypothetical protein
VTQSASNSETRRGGLTRPSWRIVCGLILLLSTLLFLYDGARRVREDQHELRLIPYLRYEARTDYIYFYAAGYMALHGQAADLYPGSEDAIVYPGDPAFETAPDDATRARMVTRGSYFNPPALPFLEAPLAALSFRTSYWLWTVISLAALAGFVAMAWRNTRGIVEAPLIVLGMLAFKETHEVVIMGHPTFVFLLTITGGFLLLRAERPVLAGLVLSTLALKPQWVVLPAVFLVVRGEWRSLAALLTACAVIFLAPFLATSVDTVHNYLRTAHVITNADLTDAPHMFSWNGFLFKLRGGPGHGGTPPPQWQVYVLMLLTLVPLAAIYRSRDFLIGASGTVLAMLIFSIHSVWYDWALLLAAALFLTMRVPQMSRGHRLEMWVVMLAVYLAASQSTAALLYTGRHYIDWDRSAVYLITPVAFAALVWLAALPYREGIAHLWPLMGKEVFPFRKQSTANTT